VVLTKIRDGAEVRGVVGRQYPEGDVFAEALFYLPRRSYPDAIGVKEYFYLEEYPEEKERIRKTARRTARQFTWEEVIGNLIQKLEYQARIQGFLAAQEGFPHPN